MQCTSVAAYRFGWRTLPRMMSPFLIVRAWQATRNHQFDKQMRRLPAGESVAIVGWAGLATFPGGRLPQCASPAHQETQGCGLLRLDAAVQQSAFT